ncbi:hypothetical protein B0A67_21595 [Flavobacterium aquidurense]|uniref:M14 family metallopeptidase n=1 Tax=Flavobacterium aquidurense TaxID=362413 RepID=UPI0009342BD9|nr:M14 family metallopeptidase [Flavobacterium aquidurense]OXA67806.1 hypothetical protein B0A67_21595 [Flavobacterium aquidurense]
MKMKLFFSAAVLLAVSANAQVKGGFKGQDPITAVSTVTRPVEKQWKGVFDKTGEEVFFGNDFAGARLNGVVKIDENTFSVLITPENTPINGSPWYAFKVWSKTNKEIKIRFDYPPNVKHRYNAKISSDGKKWTASENGTFVKREKDSNYVLTVKVSKDTTWIAAQELKTSKDISEWISILKNKNNTAETSIGLTAEGRKIPVFSIGNPSAKNKILISGRNHPPEVTGHYALEAFVASLTADTPLAKKFRKNFEVYVIPLLNPDGTDGGFWRHNSGGIDLNRDYNDFNQPETKAVRDFLQREIKDSNKLLFSIDFHSTHDDIYYTVDPNLKGNIPGFVPNWLNKVKDGIPGYTPHVKPLYFKPPTFTLFSYLFETYKTEALVFEIGDNTPKDFITKKGEVSGEEFMKLILATAK